VRIGYLTFGRDDLAYGLALCLHVLRGKHEIFRVTPRTARYVDTLVFSCFWWEHLYALADFLQKAGIRKDRQPRPRIVVGGFNAFNPVVFLPFADAVVVGDGEVAIEDAVEGRESPYVLTSEDQRSVRWGNAEQLPPFLHETNGIARIEVARGCRMPCTFCAVAQLKPYRELPLDEARKLLWLTRSKRVSLFAPEPTMHRADDELTAICHRMGKIRVDSDVRLDRIEKRSDSVPRVGVEGLSERLRRSVRKPYTNEQVVEAARKAIALKRKGLFMYLILDLPGETEDDWAEFRETLMKISELPGASDFLLKPSPSVFMPTPHTVMEDAVVHWERDYRGKWVEFFGRGDERNWPVKMAERTRVYSPEMRVMSMVSLRAGLEAVDIIGEWRRRKAYRVHDGRVTVADKRAVIEGLRQFGGPDRYCGAPKAKPWKIVQMTKRKCDLRALKKAS